MMIITNILDCGNGTVSCFELLFNLLGYKLLLCCNQIHQLVTSCFELLFHLGVSGNGAIYGIPFFLKKKSGDRFYRPFTLW